MTPEEHQTEFLYQVDKLGIQTCDRSMREIAQDVIDASTEAIRSLNYCGTPCSPSELIQEEDWATMYRSRRERPNNWLSYQILSSSTYDGSICYLVARGQERTQLGKIFTAICRAELKDPQSLLDLYQISEHEDDESSLEKICQIVSDIGFYGAAVSILLGAAESTETKSYLLLFDVGNPFPGLLKQGRFATHTWDIISLLGAYDDMVLDDYKAGISEWRQSILRFCYTGDLSCEPWQQTSQTALLIQKDGMKSLDRTMLADSRAQKLLQIAEAEGQEYGFDLLWDNVVRFFLKTGNPRYRDEADQVMAEYVQEYNR